MVRSAILVRAALLAAASAPLARAEDQPAPPQVVTYKTVGEQALSVHVFQPPRRRKPRAAILAFHGGGWAVGGPDWVHTASRMFRDEGLVAIAVQYRLSSTAPGSTTPADALADACDAFAWVRAHARELGVDPKRVAGYGVSAGGQLTAAAGLGACPNGDRGPDLMLLWSPALDVAEDGFFRRLMKGADPGPFSPLVRVMGRKPPPAFIVQGAADTLTPLKDAQAFCEAARVSRQVCELSVYPNLGHLLTRNLADQEDNYDIDPVARADGQAKLKAFLKRRGYTR